MQEYIDVYDENRQFTGVSVSRFGHPLKPGQYMLYITALLQTTDGRFLITQRSYDKHWAPGAWEVTGGGVPAGETTQEAVIREVAEEVGLDISGFVDPVPIHSYRNDDPDGGDNYFMDIFLFQFDFSLDDVSLRESEAIDCALATWDEITELNGEGSFLHYKRLKDALDAYESKGAESLEF